MTDTERERTDIHELRLFDEPEEKEHKLSIEFFELEDMIEILKESPEWNDLSKEEQEQLIKEETENFKKFPQYALVDNSLYNGYIPDIDYDGGTIQFNASTSDSDSEDDMVSNDYTFENMEEYLKWYRTENEKIAEESGLDSTYADAMEQEARFIFESVKNGNYETLEKGSINFENISTDCPFMDYRSVWECDKDAVEAIKDSIRELSIYDEEMDTDFNVMITLPPDFDPEKTYPVFLLTDGVYRFGNHPELRKLMENGEASDVILVALGYNYNMNGRDEENRLNHLVIQRDKLLDFVTDNLMPYLGELYNIDYENSSLYGHSDGGVFTHNAVFRSDRYENQPFGNYIIGSPVLWVLQNPEIESNTELCLNEYNYFKRNEALDKKLFITGGSLEDEDYTNMEKYGGDTTIQGIDKLVERLNSHGYEISARMYDSHHYQYIPEMLCDFLKEFYPAK